MMQPESPQLHAENTSGFCAKTVSAFCTQSGASCRIRKVHRGGCRPSRPFWKPVCSPGKQQSPGCLQCNDLCSVVGKPCSSRPHPHKSWIWFNRWFKMWQIHLIARGFSGRVWIQVSMYNNEASWEWSLPENREDSCHLANCTDFVSDYFFSSCSCTYFQWNKKNSSSWGTGQSLHII